MMGSVLEHLRHVEQVVDLQPCGVPVFLRRVIIGGLECGDGVLPCSRVTLQGRVMRREKSRGIAYVLEHAPAASLRNNGTQLAKFDGAVQQIRIHARFSFAPILSRRGVDDRAIRRVRILPPLQVDRSHLDTCPLPARMRPASFAGQSP